MHSYINVEKLRNFSKKKTLDSVMYDIADKYKIANIADDDGESLTYLATALYEDYAVEMTNYESYIEYGMDARLMMELRKSACLKFAFEYYDFYSGHNKLNTATEVDNYRTSYLQQRICRDYLGLNWEYWVVVKKCWGRKANGFIVDYESCFADGDWRLETTVDEYKEQFLENYALVHPGTL